MPQLRAFLRGWVALAGLGLLLLGFHLVRVGRNWPLGDWLINYEGGFVRRGLLGEVLLLTGRALHADPVLLAAMVCLACYAVLLGALWRMLQPPLQPWWAAFALCSPALLTFPLLSSRAGFHKEVLLYTAIVLVLGRFQNVSRPNTTGLVLALGAVTVFLILSHEPVIFYLPYLLIVPALATKDVRYGARVSALPALLALCGFAFVLRHIGSAATVAAICQSVHATPADPCADPIGFLTMTRAGQLAMVRENIAQFHYLRLFPILLALTASPLVLGVFRLWRTPSHRPRLRLLLGTAALAGLSSLALFRFGPDWGRWIAMHAVCFTVLLLWIAQRDEIVGTTTPQTAAVPTVASAVVPWAWCVGLIVYATCWSMPGFGDTPLHGLLGLLLHRP